MAKPTIPLSTAERVRAVKSIIAIQLKLDRAGELLAAVHLSHALDCLDPDNAIGRGPADKEF